MRHWFVFRKSTAGFTQIELMITVVVVGVLAAIAVPSLAPWLRQQQVNAAINQVDLALQESQNEAIKRNQSCQTTLTRGENVSLTGNCLISGTRSLNGVILDHSRRDDAWTISFNAQGENRSPGNDPGTLWLSAPSTQPKCLVISVGIGLRRMGKYVNNACVTP
jgi:prepilin-type N-terminal cleavage/methylation domain-containing protein